MSEPREVGNVFELKLTSGHFVYVQYQSYGRGAWMVRVLPGRFDSTQDVDALVELVAGREEFVAQSVDLHTTGRLVANIAPPEWAYNVVLPLRTKGKASKAYPDGWAVLEPDNGDVISRAEFELRYPDLSFYDLPPTNVPFPGRLIHMIEVGRDPQTGEPRR